MNFETAYEEFLHYHFTSRRGESAARLKEGLNHAEKMFAEKVWWPAFQNFRDLHPQYQIRDFKEGHRYIDFAFIQTHFRVAIEIDGFGPHWRDITADQFSDHLLRQNDLIIDGWRLLRFYFLDIRDRPRTCQKTIQQLIGRLSGEDAGLMGEESLVDREIIRLALTLARPITPVDVAKRIEMNLPAARRHLKQLVDHGWLKPDGNNSRVRRYCLSPPKSNMNL